MDEKLLEYADMLFRYALQKTRNADEAEELVQETYLHTLNALSKNTCIGNINAYMVSVLNNRFNLMLRKKYKLSTVSFNVLDNELADDTDDFKEIEHSEECAFLRKELAFLAFTYRETMVRYYMQNQSVSEIAKALGISKGTVLSRLDAGREKIKKGAEHMNCYVSNSYKPEKLVFGIDGRTGTGGEPFSCVKGSIEQNILILAYENPINTTELSKALGIPMAFIEESVEKLVDAQLLKQQGGKVFTDFVIVSPEDKLRALETSKKFAQDTFEEANEVFKNTVNKYKEINAFSVMNDTQLYLMAVLSTTLPFKTKLSTEAGGNALAFDNYPDRPNYGKWIAFASKYPGDFILKDSEIFKYQVSGKLGVSEINDYIRHMHEWDTKIGHTHCYRYKYLLKDIERCRIIDAFRTDTLTAFQADFVPDFEKLGFIRTENSIKVPNVPYLTPDEERQFFILEHAGAEMLSFLFLEKAVKVATENKIKIPKRITYVPTHAYSQPLEYLPMSYVYEAAERGIITTEKDKNYPVMFFTKKQ